MLKKKFLIAVFLSVFVVAKPAYAIIDIMAMVQSALELKKEIETKVQNIQRKISDAKKRLVQGYQLGANCFSKPASCGLNALTNLTSINEKDPLGVIILEMTGIRTVKGAESLSQGDVVNKKSENLDKTVVKAYTYVKGQEDSFKNLNENREQLNSVTADEVALLFAKGAATRQSIRNEDAKDMYPTEIGDKQSDIIAPHSAVALKSQERLTRILELRAYMAGAEATSDMGQFSPTEDEMKELLEN
jgi:hypothetical protein